MSLRVALRRFGACFPILALALWLTTLLFPAGEQSGAAELPLQIILVRTREQGEEVLRRLKAGESFEKLAAERSVDPTAADGGSLGWVKLSTLRSEIREALKGVDAGQVTGVIETPGGHAIIRVLTEAEAVAKQTGVRSGRRALQAAAHARLVTEVGGFSEVGNIFKRLQKPPNFYSDLQVVCDLKTRSFQTAMNNLSNFLAALIGEDAATPGFIERIDVHQRLGQLFAYEGEFDQALEHFQAAYKIAESRRYTDLQLILEEQLGMTYLRRVQVEHCSHHHNPRCCILPVAGQSEYQGTSSPDEAIRHWLKFLDQRPDDMEVKWLLNVACMLKGTYPNGVPPQHLIPPTAFESEEDIGRFEDVAPSTGLDLFNNAGGAAMDDFDSDGFLDIVISDFSNCKPMHYFHNNANGTFSDRTSQAGLSEQLGGLNLLQVDYNNDGWLDLYVLRGAWEFPMRNSLLRNNGYGTFSDVTREAGLAFPATATQTAAWADFNNDGHIDLFVGNEYASSQLFRNQGDGTFVDVARQAGVARVSFTKGVIAADYDNDGYPDIYVSNWGYENFLYHNNGDGTFTEVAGRLGVQKPYESFPVWFFDYDNDGWRDLFVSSYVYSVEGVVRSMLKLPVQAETMKLYRNIGGSGFQDVTEEVGLARVVMPMGANFGDLDNDGFLDFYLGTGQPSFAGLVPNLMFLNKEGKRFVDVTFSSGTGHLGKGHGVAFGDINNDGTQDIFHQVGGAVPGDRYANALFRNPGHGNNWIRVKLAGVKTNRAAIGARIKLTLKNEDGTRRSIFRDVTSGGSFGASPLEQHIGLGRATEIETLEVWWPTSKTRQSFHNLQANQFLEIREFENDVVKLKRPSFQLGEAVGRKELRPQRSANSRDDGSCVPRS